MTEVLTGSNARAAAQINGQAKRLKQLRMQMAANLGRRVTQPEVATFVGVSRASVSMWETDDIQMEYPHLEKLAEFYGVSIEYIREGKQHAPELTAPEPARATSLPDELSSDQVTLPLYRLDLEAESVAFIEGRQTTKSITWPFSYLSAISSDMGLESAGEDHCILFQQDLSWIATRTDKVVRSGYYVLSIGGRVHICEVNLSLSTETEQMANVTDVHDPGHTNRMNLSDGSARVLAACRGLQKSFRVRGKDIQDALEK